VLDPVEGARILQLLAQRYADQPPLPMQMPGPDQVRLFRVVPEVISVLDYTQGFGHTDLVSC
jgi:hypothetical protein